ncbi:MAG: BrnA antitoxin family protein [Blastocatellia bacterium]
MKNSAKEFEDVIDFSETAFKKRFQKVSVEDLPPAVRRLRETAGRNLKSRVTIYFDSDIVSRFKKMGESEGVGYQTLMNLALRRVVDGMAEDAAKADLKKDILKDKKFLRKLKAALAA